jgi:signal transduction histidine kinase
LGNRDSETPTLSIRASRPTPVDQTDRAELAAMAAGLNLDTISRIDAALLESVVRAAKSGVSVPFASLRFLGSERCWFVGDARWESPVNEFALGVTRAVVHADRSVEVIDLHQHAAYSAATAVAYEPQLQWMVSLPVRGYNNLVIGALHVFDDRPRMPPSDTELETLKGLVDVIEAALESHRARVAARAQRAMLVERLRRAHQAEIPNGAAQRRTIHDLRNALTIIRLNTQVMEEAARFDPGAFADIRGSLTMAEEAARQLNLSSRTPIPQQRPTWSNVCDVLRVRMETAAAYPDRSVRIVDESHNLGGRPTPECLADVASLIVDRALELTEAGDEIDLSLRVFPHFVRLSLVFPARPGLEERSSPVEPVLLHPARHALLAIGGSITSSASDTAHRLSVWFPLDDAATLVV